MKILNFFDIYILFRKDIYVQSCGMELSPLYLTEPLFCCSLILHIIVRCWPSVSSAEPNTIINLHSEHFCIIVIKCETKKQLLINFELPALAGC